MVSLKGMYKDVHLRGLNSTAKYYIECEKENLILHAVKYLKEHLNQGNTAVFYTFAWPTGIAVEDYDVSKVTALAQHFKKQLSSANKNDNCMNLKPWGRERN
jgi:hypothetical protein